jgi:purine-binding chemotaxis protein CheW
MNREDKHFVFTTGGQLYSLPLETVVEISQSLIFSTLPPMVHGVIGTVQLDNLPVPVVDPALLHDTEAKHRAPEADQGYIVARDDHGKLAILLDSFHRIESNLRTPASEESEESTEPVMREGLISNVALLDHTPVFEVNTRFILSQMRTKISFQEHSFSGKEKRSAAEIQSPGEITAHRCLCFYIDAMQLGVPIAEVVEVVDNVQVTPLFKVTPYLRGLINVRGRVFPCVDISSHIGLPYRPLNENTKFILLRYREHEIAVCVTAISMMREFEPNILQSSEGLFDQELGKVVSLVARLEKEMVLIVSSRAIVESDHLKSYYRDMDE